MARAATTAAPGMSLKSHLKFSSQSLLNALPPSRAERERERRGERGGGVVAKHSAKNAPNLRERQSYVKCSACVLIESERGAVDLD